MHRIDELREIIPMVVSIGVFVVLFEWTNLKNVVLLNLHFVVLH